MIYAISESYTVGGKDVSQEQPENHDEYILVNITEQIVKRRVRTAIAEMDMCPCEKCYLDA
jgi:hypothetical protein